MMAQEEEKPAPLFRDEQPILKEGRDENEGGYSARIPKTSSLGGNQSGVQGSGSGEECPRGYCFLGSRVRNLLESLRVVFPAACGGVVYLSVARLETRIPSKAQLRPGRVAFFLLTEKNHITYSSILADFIPPTGQLETWPFSLDEISGESLTNHPRRYRIR
jgi:hypothetical protein